MPSVDILSYKWIVAEAAKKSLGLRNIEEHVFITRLVTDGSDPSRIAGAAGFSVRDHRLHIYKFKCCLLAAGGAVNIFRPRSVGKGTGRAWYPVWNAGSTYAMAAEAGAELTLMENRFVPARFKDGYGPAGAWFLLFKAKAMNAAGEDYRTRNAHMLQQHGYGKFVRYTIPFEMDAHGMPGLKLCAKPGTTECVFLTDRPVSCRYYALGSIGVRRNDERLPAFSMRFLTQVLFGEMTIPVRRDARDRRMEKRGEIWAARREEAASRYREDQERQQYGD